MKLPVALIVFGICLSSVGVVLTARADSGEVGRVAGRLNNTQQVTPLVPPPSAAVVCNSMTYVGYDPGPSGICFRAVTAQRGWSEARTNAWFPFIISEYSSVVQGESAHCWNVRRNEIIEAGEVCNEANKTIIGPRGEDAGFGGATSSLWGQGAILCEGWGVCSYQQILASPYTSMLYSIVIPVEELGSRPWCYSARSIEYHDCWEAPDR